MKVKSIREKIKSIHIAYPVTAVSVILVFLLCACVIYLSGWKNDNFYAAKDELVSLNDGWTVSDSYGRVIAKDVSLPLSKDIEGSSISISRKLPEGGDKISALLFDNNRQRMSVYIDKDEIYSVNRGGIYKLLAVTGTNLVRLKKYDDGAILSITVYEPDNAHCNIAPIKGGSISAAKIYISDREIWTFVNILIMLIVVIVLVLSFICMRLKALKDGKVPTLLIFVSLTVVWAFGDSSFYTLTPLNIETAALISYAVFPFITMSIIAYTMSMCNGSYRYLRMLLLANCGIILLRMLLAIGGVAKFNTTLWMEHLYIMLSMMLCIKCSHREYKEHPDKYTASLFVGLVIVFIMAVTVVATYKLKIGSAYRAIGLTTVSILFAYMSIMSIYTNVTAAVDHRHDHERMNLLENEVNTDSLTGLGNRYAFNRLLEEIERDPESFASAILVMLDLNGLKYTNDTYGHEAGDELITYAAKCISETVGSEAECFRIGGDEFTVVLRENSGSIDMRLAEMNRWIEKHNKNARYKLSMAHGESSLRYPEGDFKSVSDWKQEADINMYNNKELSSIGRFVKSGSEYQDILRHIINCAGNLNGCREEIDKGLGSEYDPEIGQIVLDNWDELTDILLNKNNRNIKDVTEV